MKSMRLQSERLTAVLQTPEQVERMIEQLSEYDRAQVSSDWLARMRAATTPDPWVHGFRVVHRDSGEAVGSCSFKGPPVDGMVEIAYGIGAEHRGRGFATEAAQALVAFASTCADVRVIRAHTLPDSVASKRVLAKCGFQYVGEVVDPEDGLVYRFERLVRRGC
jgi:RimJ/RimL family protein N-acetyltransferase